MLVWLMIRWGVGSHSFAGGALGYAKKKGGVQLMKAPFSGGSNANFAQH